MIRELLRPGRATAALTGAFFILGAAAAPALAAGGAFAVDDAGVGDAGECKVETWASLAGNGDRVFVLAPACVVPLGVPVEVGVQFDRVRGGGEWGTGLGVKAKAALIPQGDGVFGLALSGGMVFDLTARETAAWYVNLPLTIQLAAPLSVNLNAGALWDRLEQRTYLTWGAGFMLALSEPVTLIGEVFGQGSDDPGAQLGLRYTPHEKIDFDLIYGRNLAGERADWVTLGMNLRF